MATARAYPNINLLKAMTATILVIEDDHATRTCLLDFFAEEFTVIAAADGAKGLQMSQEALPDLIICDIDMPYYNGYQVLEQLRADIHTAEIPFIFLSAHASPEKISQAAEMGADDYLIKPIRLMQLSGVIKSKLKKKPLMRVLSGAMPTQPSSGIPMSNRGTCNLAVPPKNTSIARF